MSKSLLENIKDGLLAASSKLHVVVSSRAFFWLIIALFVLESAWIALSAGYPQIYDENTHLGIIRLFAEQWSPIFTEQPEGADTLGALTADPSYLYRYLMSFPYRVASLFTNSEMIHVLVIRSFSIVFFATALLVFHKIMRQINVSSAIANTVLLFFILIPAVPFLAAQINYGNLVILVAAITLLLTLRIRESLQRQKRIPLHLLLLVIAIGMLGCLVQFQFLPILTAVSVYLVLELWKFYRYNAKSSWKELQKHIVLSSRISLTATISLFVISTALFVQQYGVNMVHYHSPVPQCGQVLGVERCLAYAPYKRNYMAKQDHADIDPNPIRYTAGWAYRMTETSFFTQSGGVHPAALYLLVHPLPVITVTAVTILLGGLILLLRYRKEIFQKYPALLPLSFISLFYVGVLWLRNYYDYLQLGEKVGINGRYLLPVIIIVMLCIALAYNHALRQKPHAKTALLAVVFILFLQGGGAISFIYASNQYWYWREHNQTISEANDFVRKIISPVIID